jgi:hypothetical protein
MQRKRIWRGREKDGAEAKTRRRQEKLMEKEENEKEEYKERGKE